METKIVKGDSLTEFLTPERCSISEYSQPEDENISIAIAKVIPGVRTRLHYLKGIDERYLIISGKGLVEIEGLPATEVKPRDLVIIPAGKSQRIKNIGQTDLEFYCICNPKFKNHCYVDVEET